MLGLSGTLLLYEEAWLRATVPHATVAPVRTTAAAVTGVGRLTAVASSRAGGRSEDRVLAAIRRANSLLERNELH